MIVLGIETSCDETGVALYSEADGLLGHLYHSQIALHQPYGGVVPEIASRDHVQKLVPLVESLLEKTRMEVSDISGVAYTAGPGLAGALLVGAAFARSFAFAREIPAVGIHHLEGHLLSPFLEKDTPEFPFLALLVSGGHTLLIEVSALGVYKIKGQSIDDAAGEAFDKTARLLGLPYPGGAALSALAQSGNPAAYAFPRPMPHSLNFSFSGLKTAVAQQISKEILSEQTRADIAASFQAAVVDSLIHKSLQALKETGLKQLVVSGGVSANESLRSRLTQEARALGVKVFYPALEFCTDNGAMIAYAGYKRLQQGQTNNLDFSIKARWSLEES